MRFSKAPLLLATFLLASCSSDDADPASASATFPDALAEKAVATYKQNVHENYAATKAAAAALSKSIDAFLAAPSEANLATARTAWIAARVPYAPSEAYRFYDGPIDDPDAGPEGQINAWPLDENAIDYTRDDASAGLINDLSVAELTKEAIAAANEKGGEKSITTGFHAIEFLLWGQDDQTPGKGAGKRPATDYADGPAGSAKNQARRREYLKNVTALLVDDLDALETAWAPNADNFAKTFGVVATDPAAQPDAKKEAIGKLLRSIGSLAKAELAGERMSVAYKNRSQEDEHDCFSDNTSADLYGNGLGIQNVWLGRYGANDGTGLDEVVAAVDPSLASKTTTDIATAVAKLDALRALQDAGTPLDVIIQQPDDAEGRKAMLAAIQALKEVGADVEKCAAALKLSVALETSDNTL